MPKVYIKTFGCQMNEYDSTMIKGMLYHKGYIPTENIEEAQLIILNTCSVRESAESKALSHIGLLKKIKTKNPEVIIIVAGCMAQRMEVNLQERFPYIDIVLGTQNLFNLPSIFEEFIRSRQKIVATKTLNSSKGQVSPARLGVGEIKLKAFVTIMRGCSNFCSYCIVPYVRGKERSKPIEMVISEVEDSAQQGCKEITLLGQNVNSYFDAHYAKDGVDYNFARLLGKINEIEGIERIRFTTSHPKDMIEETILKIKDLSNVCEHIHLPVQQGSNKILQKMNRGYTREEYIKLTQKIRKIIPRVSITTDIMVGYPQETEEDFEDTLNLVKEVCFDAAYTFKYSPRPGTKAACEEDNVCRDEKERRLAELIDLCRKLSIKQNQKSVGKMEEVLVERENKNDPSKVYGRTRSNKIVVFKGKKELIGSLIKVKITEAYTFSLLGEVPRVKS